MIITNQNVSEFEVHKFSAFASDLGLSPGYWPTELETTLGNKLPLVRASRLGEEGGFLYVQTAGCVSVKIYND
jgi:hypothetical protein